MHPIRKAEFIHVAWLSEPGMLGSETQATSKFTLRTREVAVDARRRLRYTGTLARLPPTALIR